MAGVSVYTSVKVAKVCEQIVQQLEKAVRSGQLVAGERLPSERKLAKEFRVSRMTLRRAVQVMCKKGLLEVCGGRGTFVGDRLHGGHPPPVEAAKRGDVRIGLGR